MKRKPKPGLPRLFDRPKYRQRNIIERMFGWLKENRALSGLVRGRQPREGDLSEEDGAFAGYDLAAGSMEVLAPVLRNSTRLRLKPSGSIAARLSLCVSGNLRFGFLRSLKTQSV